MSIFDIIRQLNWIDFVIIILLLRICYNCAKTGFPAELFKLLGVLAAIFLSLHYYAGFSDWLGRVLPSFKEKTPLEFLDFSCVFSLAVSGYGVCILLRFAFLSVIKVEPIPALNRWGGFIVGVIRAFLVAGLVVFMLAISSITYLKGSVNDSYLGPRMFRIAPATYTWMWNSFFSKLAPGAKFNDTVLEVQEYIRQDK